ncbi:hypothetical protein A5740_24690 [Mycobacterium sp. GA-1841]|uniref:hypothetical protein n=1 Tax=Mycobacterium sp. GA-1841 TaxID=1834154 RepID=UPI0009701D46|nr:hypothetical protein [Mycobacterium sp. GA-1841]OMC40210.1 hypothetical protein A5740_24690 [Mycobacterium sp. GA-1841]
MTNPARSALLAATLAIAAVVSAPIADARPTCSSSGGTTTICETNGSVSIKARPGTTAPPAAQPVFPWLGLPGT